MATVRQALKTHLLADATLAALLTGGVLDAEDLPLDGGSLSDIPLQNDGVRIKPFVVCRWRLTTPKEIIASSQRRTLELYFYQDVGYATIEAAQQHVKSILHQVKLLAADDAARYAFFNWQQDRGELPAPEFGNVASIMSRYSVDYLRSS